MYSWKEIEWKSSGSSGFWEFPLFYSQKLSYNFLGFSNLHVLVIPFIQVFYIGSY